MGREKTVIQGEITFKKRVSLFLKGLAMGAANKVPGVSGGAVSYVLGDRKSVV